MLIFGQRVETYESFPTVWLYCLEHLGFGEGEGSAAYVCVGGWGHFGLVPGVKGY